MGIGIAIGLDIGAAFGDVMENFAVGLGIGAVIGVSLCSLIGKKYNQKT